MHAQTSSECIFVSDLVSTIEARLANINLAEKDEEILTS